MNLCIRIKQDIMKCQYFVNNFAINDNMRSIWTNDNDND